MFVFLRDERCSRLAVVTVGNSIPELFRIRRRKKNLPQEDFAPINLVRSSSTVLKRVERKTAICQMLRVIQTVSSSPQGETFLEKARLFGPTQPSGDLEILYMVTHTAQQLLQ